MALKQESQSRLIKLERALASRESPNVIDMGDGLYRGLDGRTYNEADLKLLASRCGSPVLIWDMEPPWDIPTPEAQP